MSSAFSEPSPLLSPEAKIKGSFFVDLLQTVVIALAISVFIYLVIAIPNQVDGQSMEPNFHDKELLLTNKVIQWLGSGSIGKSLHYDYNRGDVVIFTTGGTDLIKRVIGMPGDKLSLKNDHVYINGQLLDEKYIPTTTRTRAPYELEAFIKEGEVVTVPDGSYFVMGDNRENSKDSRFKEVGFVRRDQIKGLVFFRYWPLDKFGIIKRGESTLVSENNQ